MDSKNKINYLGALLLVKISKKNRGIDVYQLKLNNCGKIALHANYPFRLDSTTHNHFESTVEMSIVYFQELGLDLPCLLALVKDGNTVNRRMAYFFTLMNESLQLFNRIPLPSVMSKEQIICFDFKILDGPTILILDKNCGSMYICNCIDGIFKKYNFASLGFDSSLSNDYWIKSTASDFEYRAICYIGIKLKTGLVRTSPIKLSVDGTIEKLSPIKESGLLLPPNEYWQSLTTFSYHKLRPDICSKIFTQSSSSRESVILLATEMKQFVISKGNCNIRCYDIPFGDCLNIEKLEVPNFDTLFLLTSKSSQSCVVSWKQKKVIKHWTGVHEAFVGDFCQSGHKQILILFSNVNSKIDDVRFSLTDFLCCKKGLDVDNEPAQNVEAQKSLQAVEMALTNNVQAMKHEIEVKQATFDKKSELLKETWLSMQRNSIRFDLSERRTPRDLVPLFESEIYDLEEKTDQGLRRDESPFKILDQHQFITLDRLVVSLKLLNNTDKQLKNPNLQLFLKDHLSQSHVLSYSHQRLSSEDRMHTDTKRDSPISAKPGDILILTATTEVPQLHLNQPVDVPIIVGWHQHDSRHSFSCCVGKAMLDLKNYSDMLYFPEHLSVTDHLETVQVEVISSLYNLSDFLDGITNTFKKLKCEVMVGAKHFESKNHLDDTLRRVFICLSDSGMIAAIDIQARSVFDATQLFCVLQSELPNGCIVTLPLRKQQELIGKFASCLSRELSVLKRIFTRHESDTEANSDMEVDIPCDLEKHFDDCKQTVQKIRQQFHRKRKLAEMLMQDGDSLKIGQQLYGEYRVAMQETNSMGELLVKINMLN